MGYVMWGQRSEENDDQDTMHQYLLMSLRGSVVELRSAAHEVENMIDRLDRLDSHISSTTYTTDMVYRIQGAIQRSTYDVGAQLKQALAGTSRLIDSIEYER